MSKKLGRLPNRQVFTLVDLMEVLRILITIRGMDSGLRKMEQETLLPRRIS